MLRVLFRRWDGNENRAISLLEVDQAMKAAMADLPGATEPGGVGPKEAALSTWAGAWTCLICTRTNGPGRRF